MKRRQFIQSAAALTAAGLLPFSPVSAGILGQLGVQLFSIPTLLEKDFRAGIQLLARIGYREVELYGPFPFSTAAAKARWDSITPSLGWSGSGYFGHSAQEVKAILAEAKISTPSIHTDLDTMRTNMGQLGEASQVLGFQYIGLPSLPAEFRKNLDDYKRAADVFNQVGAEAKKSGVKFTYHNHGYGLQETQGKIPLEVLFELTDPSLVFFEMDIYWTTAGGLDPVALLRKYPGRYHLMHVKDMKKKVRFSGDGGDSNQWVELFPYMTTAGDGVMDLKSIVKAGKETGVKHFFVEQDMVASPEVALKRSFDYVKAI